MSDLSHPSSAGLTRAKSSVARIAEAWIRRDPDKGSEFTRYLKDFLRLYVTNDNTRRSYSFAILEFFDWHELTFNSIPTPDRIERATALRYAEWLRTRDYGLEDFRLHRSHDQALEAAIYDAVKAKPGAHISDIRKAIIYKDFAHMVGDRRVLDIESSDAYGLDKFLACMVLKKILTRTPSVEELRQRFHEIRADDRIEPETFAYSVDQHTDAKGYARSRTIVSRLTALSSFWKYVIEHTGENLESKARALSVNIWQDPIAQFSKKVPSFAEAARASRTPDIELFQRLLDTTGESGAQPQEMHFDDVRDRAILLFYYYCGVRASELGSLKRADVSGVPPIVTVIGKGSRVRQFTVPEPAMDGLRELDEKIRQLSTNAEHKAPGSVPRISRLLRSDAPLFPAVYRWGCSAKSARAKDEDGLTRSAIAMMLRRRCFAAGIQKGTPEFKRVHNHGFRHLAAKSAISAGVPLNKIQAVLGHQDLSTTGIYVQERDPGALSLSPTAPVVRKPEAPAKAPSPAPAPPAKGPVIIETVGYEVHEEAPAPIAVPEEEKLVAVGEQGPPQRPLPSQVEIEALERQAQRPTEALEGVRAGTFDNAYSKISWGGKPNRTPLHKKKAESAVTDISAEEDALTSTYVGDDSGLIWWAGPRNALKPEMPVMSPDQIAERPNLRSGLEDLWLRWVTDQETDGAGAHVERGPTAARALLDWFRAGLDLTEQVSVELRRRGGRWVEYDAPKKDTAYKEVADRFREHRDDKVLLWYGIRAYSFMTATGREGSESVEKKRIGGVVDVTTMPPEPPGPWGNTNSYRPKVADKVNLLSWFDAADPVAELPPEEKAELFDWLAVLTGKPPVDKTKRYPRATGEAPALSRAELATFLLQLCAYDGAEDERKAAGREKGRGGGGEEDYQEAEEASKLYAATVDATAAKLKGKGFKLDIAKRVEERIKGRKEADVEGEGRRARSSFYVDILKELFGEEAAKDPALRLYASCEKGHPLAKVSLPLGGEYRDFFRVDIGKGTIVHTPDFELRFAKATGAHSECVARRVARYMWELKRIGHRSAGERSDELLTQIANWAYFKVPCPAPLEAELRERLKGAPPVDLLNAFDGFAEEQKQKRPKTFAEARAMRSELESRAELGLEREVRIDPVQLVEGFQVEQRGPRAEDEEEKKAKAAKKAAKGSEPTQRNYVANAKKIVPGPITIYLLLHLSTSSC